MDTPNQNFHIDPGAGSAHDQHSQIDPGAIANHNDALSVAGTAGGVVTGAVIVDAALHAASQAIPPGMPLAGEVMQGTAQMVDKGVQTPMSVGSVAAMAGKVAYETAKVAIPETLEAAKVYAAEAAAGLGRIAAVDAVTLAQVGVLAVPLAIVGSAVLTTPDPEPLHPINLDPAYGVTHTENMSVQPAAPQEASIDPGTDPHQPNMSHDTNDKQVPVDPGIHDNQSIDPGIHDNQSLDPGAHDNQSIDPHMPVDSSAHDNQSIDPHMPVDSSAHENQSIDPHMAVDSPAHDNQSIDQHMSFDPAASDNHQSYD